MAGRLCWSTRRISLKSSSSFYLTQLHDTWSQATEDQMREPFLVSARRPLDGALDQIDASEPATRPACQHSLHNLLAHRRVANSPIPDMLLARLKLRLDQNHHVAARAHHALCGVNHLQCRDERHVQAHKIHTPSALKQIRFAGTQIFQAQIPQVCLLHHSQSRVCADLLVDLPETDVHPEYMRHPVLQQTIRKSTSTQPRIQCHTPLEPLPHAERVQCRLHLQPSPAHKFWHLGREPYRRSCLDPRPALGHWTVIHEHLSLGYERLDHVPAVLGVELRHGLVQPALSFALGWPPGRRR
mmetsp:Transcript_3958/g.11375  ORF Transcript_3958/g.11375 Transcript_3958/m.11375 type:complete len:299 (+) Transcript_3958:1523-2419(+)